MLSLKINCTNLLFFGLKVKYAVFVIPLLFASFLTQVVLYFLYFLEPKKAITNIGFIFKG